MKRRRTVAGLLAAQLAASGCATIVNGRTDQVRIQSVPDAADVEIRDHEDLVVAQGQTPMTAELRRGSGFVSAAVYMLHVSKEGYLKRVVPLSTRTSGWWYGNLVLGLGIGTVFGNLFDNFTGGAYDLPEVETVTLEPDVPLIPVETPSAARE